MSQKLTREDNDIQGQDTAKTIKSPDTHSSTQAMPLSEPATLEWSPHQKGQETLGGHGSLIAGYADASRTRLLSIPPSSGGLGCVNENEVAVWTLEFED